MLLFSGALSRGPILVARRSLASYGLPLRVAVGSGRSVVAEEDLLALHEALEQFTLHDPVKARLVELRFFGGLTTEEAAEVLGISRSTAKREWNVAKAWLSRQMKRGSRGPICR